MKTKKFGKIHTYSLLLVFLFIAIISCNKNPYNRLLGTWENKQPNFTETYIYDGINFDAGSYKMKVKSIIWSSDASGII